VLVGLLVEHIALPANFVLLSDLSAGEERCYPDETLRPSALSPCRYGRLSLRITRRWSGQFTSMLNAAQQPGIILMKGSTHYCASPSRYVGLHSGFLVPKLRLGMPSYNARRCTRVV
jgi:hypothetical protein